MSHWQDNVVDGILLSFLGGMVAIKEARVSDNLIERIATLEAKLREAERTLNELRAFTKNQLAEAQRIIEEAERKEQEAERGIYEHPIFQAEVRQREKAAVQYALERSRREDAERERDYARNYAAEIAQGVSHYLHGDGEPCVRCDRDRLQAEVDDLERQVREFLDGEPLCRALSEGVRLQAENERLRRALEAIGNHDTFGPGGWLIQIARTALRETGGEKGGGRG